MKKKKIRAAFSKRGKDSKYWCKINNYEETPLNVVYAIIDHIDKTDWKSIWMEAQNELTEWGGVKSLEHKQRVLTFIVKHQHLLK